MSGNRFKFSTGAITTGTSTKTLLQLVAASNHKVLIEKIFVGFNGVSSTGEPIKVEILRQTTAGTMSSLTMVKDGDWDETMQTTAQHTATAEPTAGDVLETVYIHPQQSYTFEFGYGRELPIPGGGRLGVRVTAPASVSAIVSGAGRE